MLKHGVDQHPVLIYGVFLDLWELPPSRQTHEIADVVEEAFYSRCPPENRPLFMRTSRSDPEVEAANALENDPEKAESASSPDQLQYDKSLFKALLNAFSRRTWFAIALVVLAGT